MRNFLKILRIDEYSITPYYAQIYNSILRAIEDNLIDKDDVLPSINDLSIALDISRNTITRAYNDLKKIGVINSVPGKGYFISNTRVDQPVRVLLLFNKLSAHKKLLYDAFAGALANKASIDFYIYNSNFNFFKKLLLEKQDKYDKVVIVPHFRDKADNAFEVINEVPKEKLILMGKLIDGVTGQFGAVYEDFQNDIYNALTNLADKVRQYTSLTIVFPKQSYFSTDILIGFLNFCKAHNCDYDIISDFKSETILKNSLYITLTEDDLVELIDKALSINYKMGEDIGIISYNETALKRLILNGITTISTDFGFMGEKAAELVLNNSTEHHKVPFNTIIRNSI
ncbi:GntR family transcriptional regulator [Mucilaginibacter conchicola]|uniref:GntR family transcriptional regulator n=1 Tax=Mucilaginibacter conchicola TaxID=2303333 RepID=A0A372NZM1_9SPHI|nr:GntR family transcriptional regulator [Mucilaginibacter conchicola]RFZ95578.1 GntR family transcriptional regulator [Mucilaginibacter conchicola]